MLRAKAITVYRTETEVVGVDGVTVHRLSDGAKAVGREWPGFAIAHVGTGDTQFHTVQDSGDRISEKLFAQKVTRAGEQARVQGTEVDLQGAGITTVKSML